MNIYICLRGCFGKAAGDLITLDESEARGQLAMGGIELLSENIARQVRRQLNRDIRAIKRQAMSAAAEQAVHSVREKFVTDTLASFGQTSQASDRGRASEFTASSRESINGGRPPDSSQGRDGRHLRWNQRQEGCPRVVTGSAAEHTMFNCNERWVQSCQTGNASTTHKGTSSSYRPRSPGKSAGNCDCWRSKSVATSRLGCGRRPSKHCARSERRGDTIVRKGIEGGPPRRRERASRTGGGSKAVDAGTDRNGLQGDHVPAERRRR